MPRSKLTDRSVNDLPAYIVRKVRSGPSGYQVEHRFTRTLIGPPMAQGQAIELARSLEQKSRRADLATVELVLSTA